MDYFVKSDEFDLQREIARITEEKRKYLMADAGITDEDEWRKEIKRQVEAELEQRVREAFDVSIHYGCNQSRLCKDQLKTSSSTSDHEPRFKHIVSKALNQNPDDLRQELLSLGLNSQEVEYMKAKLNLHRNVKSCTVATNDTDQNRLTSLLYKHLKHDSDKQFEDFLNSCNTSRQFRFREYYSQVKDKAFYDFGSLSSAERHSFFYLFTRDGFNEALRTGKLPDGSSITLTKDGKYVDQYGIVRDEHGPFWPVDWGPLHPTPIHQRFHERINGIEAFYSHDPNEPDITVREQQHRRYPAKWRNLSIVFDSEKSSRETEVPPSPEGVCPSLCFESRFESGNLRQARRIGQFEYELVLQTDLYTTRHTQWYYFKMWNMEAGITYKFKIINLLKKNSLYNQGMQPLLYSEKLASTRQKGWHRCGHHISYSRNINHLQCSLLSRERDYYILEWQMEFPSSNDVCYLAHCYPYTFADLRQDIDVLLKDQKRAEVAKKDVLCLTKAGNSCFVLTISDFESKAQVPKRGVFITARVHPGETNSSWVMKGLLDYLTSSNPTAKELRRKFVFKVIPMLNPDGVIVGNYRCGLSGRDLNRNYRHPSPQNFPTVWHLKSLMSNFAQSNEIMLFCDMHGHSRQQNVFMYGCVSNFSPNDPDSIDVFLKGRLVPWIMAQKAPDKFSFRGCKFHIRRSKESTGRVVMYRQLNVVNSFTMETTFCGTNICSGQSHQFNTNDLEQVGQKFCDVILEYKKTTEDKKLESMYLIEMSKVLLHMMREQIDNKQRKSDSSCIETRQSWLSDTNVDSVTDITQYLRMMDESDVDNYFAESDSSSSDSEPEPELVEKKMKRIRQRKNKKKRKTSKQTERDQMSADQGKTEGAGKAQKSNLPAIAGVGKEDRKRTKERAAEDDRKEKRNTIKHFPPFVNRYEGRTNNGIPCFAEERLEERAKRRIAELKRRLMDVDEYQNLGESCSGLDSDNLGKSYIEKLPEALHYTHSSVSQVAMEPAKPNHSGRRNSCDYGILNRKKTDVISTSRGAESDYETKRSARLLNRRSDSVELHPLVINYSKLNMTKTDASALSNGKKVKSSNEHQMKEPHRRTCQVVTYNISDTHLQIEPSGLSVEADTLPLLENRLEQKQSRKLRE